MNEICEHPEETLFIKKKQCFCFFLINKSKITALFLSKLNVIEKKTHFPYDHDTHSSDGFWLK